MKYNSLCLYLSHGGDESDISIASNININKSAEDLIRWFPDIPQSADFVYVDDGEVEFINWDLFCDGFYNLVPSNRQYIESIIERHHLINPIALVLVRKQYDSTDKSNRFLTYGRYFITK